jgi:ABC-type transporter Mla subunit MlaD
MRLQLGLLVVAAAVFMAALVLMFGSLPNLFRPTTTYTVRLTDAPGLTPGAPVRRSGVRIGTVKRITLDDERAIVRVVVAIDEPYHLRRGEQATLVTGLLGSDASIDFLPEPEGEAGAGGRDVLEPGAEVVGVRAASVNTLLKGASDVVPTTQETLNDIRKSLQRLDRLAARYERMTPLVEDAVKQYRDLARSANAQIPELQRTNVEYRELARSARQALPDLQRTNEEVRQLARDARGALPELMKTNAEAQAFLRAGREVMPQAERTLAEYRELAADVRKNIPAVRATVDDVGAAARNATRLLERGDVMLQANRETIEETLRNLNRATAQANKLLGDENLANVRQTLSNVRTASEPLPRMSRNADDILQQGRTTVRQMNTTLAQLQATLRDVQAVTGPLGARSAGISRNADESLARLNKILQDVQSLLKVVDRSDGTFRKFLTDPSLYNNADCAAAMVARMMPRLERILKDFEVFADKLARQPELLGVRGAIAPSSGLKGPPTPPIGPGH